MLSFLILSLLVAVPLLLISGKMGKVTRFLAPAKPQSIPVGLLVLCLVVFGVCVSSTLASASDAYGYSGKYNEHSRKGGDLYIMGYGMYGYPYGSRMGSRGNRGYMGGGLRGGK